LAVLHPAEIKVACRLVGVVDPGGVLIADSHNALLAALLALFASAMAWRSRRVDGRSQPVRLAPSCVVAAAVALPAPYALLVAIAALVASRGSGLAGASGPGARASVAASCGALAAAVAGLAVVAFPPLAAATTVYAALVGATIGIEAAMGTRGYRGRTLLYEIANIVAATVLLHSIRDGDAAALLGVLALLLVATFAGAALARALDDVNATNDALASRISELATVHAIGREILATLDPQRIFAIVERECRKIFEVDFFFIGILDRDTNEIRIAYRPAGEDAPTETSRPLSDGLAAWIVREKRALRIDDASAGEQALPFRPHMVNEEVRSVLAVPLLVGERVVGVLSLQSRRPRAYDEHQLSVLATIAQQAAVAVENAHHYTLATIDSLTGLHLRDYFFRRFEEEYTRVKRYAGAFSILMLDLDGFKEINDRHGHLAGDRYLRAVGAAIRVRMRGADLACRYGGDEFCILLPETDLAGARPIAERLRQALARLVVDVEDASLRTTVSIGIASFPEHDTGELKSLLLRADQALYQAKRAGRDRVVPFAA
jgi:diguanylate cyclase (GGDEF)-like protein